MSELIEGLSNRVISTTGCKVTEEAIALIIYEYLLYMKTIKQKHEKPFDVTKELL